MVSGYCGVRKMKKEKKKENKYIYDTVGGGKHALIDSASSIPSSLLEMSLNGGSNGEHRGAPITSAAKSLGRLQAHMEDGIDTPEKLNDDTAWSLVPGIGAYRNERRHIYVDNKLSGGKNTHKSRIAELLGGRVSSVIPLILGSIAGSYALNRFTNPPAELATAHRFAGAGLGALITGLGLLGVNGIGRAAGFLRDRRTDAEHKDYLENGPILGQYLIPGVASYYRGRRARMAKNILG